MGRLFAAPGLDSLYMSHTGALHRIRKHLDGTPPLGIKEGQKGDVLLFRCVYNSGHRTGLSAARGVPGRHGGKDSRSARRTATNEHA